MTIYTKFAPVANSIIECEYLPALAAFNDGGAQLKAL